MTLNFPNLSRRYDEWRRAVCFWGYDSALKITFFVEADALRKLGRQSGDQESSYLESFDDAREQIIAVACKAYARPPARPLHAGRCRLLSQPGIAAASQG